MDEYLESMKIITILKSRGMNRCYPMARVTEIIEIKRLKSSQVLLLFILSASTMGYTIQAGQTR